MIPALNNLYNIEISFAFLKRAAGELVRVAVNEWLEKVWQSVQNGGRGISAVSAIAIGVSGNNADLAITGEYAVQEYHCKAPGTSPKSRDKD